MDWLEGVAFWLEMPNTPVATLELQVAANMREKLRPAASSLPTPATLQTAQLPIMATAAPTAEQILQQIQELVLSTEEAQGPPVIPISSTELQQLQKRIPMEPYLTAPKGLASLTAMGCSLQLVKPDSPMTASEMRQWLLGRRQLKAMTAPSTSAT